jgi:cobalt-precorrin 5A hydrolase
MIVGIVAFSERGWQLGARLQAHFAEEHDIADLVRCGNGGLSGWTSEHFRRDDALVFVGSCGIAVRAVAPFVSSKTSDPAVVVIDELATYCVALLSGHIGGANGLATRLAALTGALPVVTTATDRHGVFSIDTWATKQGLAIVNPERIKSVSVRLLAGEGVGLKSLFPVKGRLPDGVSLSDGAYHALITYKTNGKSDALRLVPRVVTLGIGCKKNTDAATIESAFELMLAKASCHPAAIGRVCSIDMKAAEPGILEFCAKHKLPYVTFSAGELLRVPGTFTSSAFVQSIAGVGNVCERSAVLGSGEGGQLISGKNAGFGVTMALALAPYTVRFDEGGNP